MMKNKRYSFSMILTSFLLGSLLTYVVMDFNKGSFNQVNDEVSVFSSATQKKKVKDQRQEDLKKLTESLEKEQQEMDARMKQILKKAFGGASAFSFGNIDMDADFSEDFKVEQREDSQFKYIDILVDGVDQNGMNINIENGMINLTGEIVKEVNRQGSSFKSISKFNRSFNIPYGVDEDKAEFETTERKFTIKFPKRG